MPEFIPGLDLAEKLFHDVVKPLLLREFPRLRYSAALIGYGSEVLGFDTAMSMDHAWAPRMQVFLDESEISAAPEVEEMLGRNLPTHFEGFPLGTLESKEEPGVFFMDENVQPGRVRHKVIIGSLRDFVRRELDWDINESLEPADWLSFPAQVLRVLTAGKVFYDELGSLTSLRQRLKFYPKDVWLYLLGCGWDRIGQEQPLMQRAGFVGDELGSAIMGSRLARDIMALCFLMEEQYAPYPKWFGSAFGRLQCSADFIPILWKAQKSDSWQERSRAIGKACELLAQKQNALGLTDPLPEVLSSFHGRPFKVINAEKYCQALFQKIEDPEINRIAAKGPLGNLDQISDNTILRSDPQWRAALRKLYL